jgi:ribosomal protein L37AE/L43A
MICRTCGEVLAGDGYTEVLHCPRVEGHCAEPDANPIHCEEDDES